MNETKVVVMSTKDLFWNEKLFDWMYVNKALIAIGVIVLFIFFYNIYKKKVVAKTVEEQKKWSLPSFQEFSEFETMEQDNIVRLEDHLKLLEVEIHKKTAAFQSAKKKYVEMGELGKRLRHHIPLLEQQRQSLASQINILKQRRNANENNR